MVEYNRFIISKATKPNNRIEGARYNLTNKNKVQNIIFLINTGSLEEKLDKGSIVRELGIKRISLVIKLLNRLDLLRLASFILANNNNSYNHTSKLEGDSTIYRLLLSNLDLLEVLPLEPSYNHPYIS